MKKKKEISFDLASSRFELLKFGRSPFQSQRLHEDLAQGQYCDGEGRRLRSITRPTSLLIYIHESIFKIFWLILSLARDFVENPHVHWQQLKANCQQTFSASPWDLFNDEASNYLKAFRQRSHKVLPTERFVPSAPRARSPNRFNYLKLSHYV